MKRILTIIVGLVMVVGFGSQAQARVKTVPFVSTEIKSLPQATKGDSIPFVETRDRRLILVQGPFGPAQTGAYATRLMKLIKDSPTLQQRLDYLKLPGRDRAVVLVGRRGGPPSEMPDENSEVDLFIVRVQPTGKNVETADLLADANKRVFHSAVVASVNPSAAVGQDPVTCLRTHPRKGVSRRWANMMARVEARMRNLGGDATKGPRKLVLVQAPLPSARDKGFANQIMDRLAGSETVKNMLAQYQIGGDVLAVAFPRTGSDWTMKHNDDSKIGAFIMLVRKDKAISEAQLFSENMRSARKLEAGFMVEMDFGISPSKDPVYEHPFVVGPFCDLEERWDFFLSCLN